MVGSAINYVMANSQQPKPQVGMGVTILYYSDRHAGTIVEVVNEKTIVVQEDRAERTDKNGMSESQRYTFTPNPDAPRIIVTLRKNGRWIKKGNTMHNGLAFLLGHRSAYHDYTF